MAGRGSLVGTNSITLSNFGLNYSTTLLSNDGSWWRDEDAPFVTSRRIFLVRSKSAPTLKYNFISYKNNKLCHDNNSEVRVSCHGYIPTETISGCQEIDESFINCVEHYEAIDVINSAG